MYKWSLTLQVKELVLTDKGLLWVGPPILLVQTFCAEEFHIPWLDKDLGRNVLGKFNDGVQKMMNYAKIFPSFSDICLKPWTR